MKTIYLIAPGVKGENRHITEECQQSIETNGIPGIPVVNRLQINMSIALAEQTIEAFEAWLLYKHSKAISEPPINSDPFIGLEAREISLLITEEVKRALKEEDSIRTLYQAIKYYGPKDAFSSIGLNAMKAILHMFMQMKEEDVCLSISLSPIIEMVFEWFSQENIKKEIVSLSGIKIVQEGKTTSAVLLN